MRWLLTIFLVLASGSARPDDAVAAPDIVSVLKRSQQMRLDALTEADRTSSRARKLHDSFDSLMRAHSRAPQVELRIVRGDVLAETVHGNIVVANEVLGDLPESERLFILAHEIGHVMLGHWAQMGTLYLRWVPGEVTQRYTDRIAGQLGADASAMAHRHEFEADAFGLRSVRALGLTQQDVLASFVRLGMRNDTATHPATRKRVAALRSTEPAALHAETQLAPGR